MDSSTTSFTPAAAEGGDLKELGYYIFLGGWQLLAISTLLLFLHHRHNPYIRNRNLPLTIFNTVIQSLLVTLCSLQIPLVGQFPCVIDYWSINLLLPLYMVSIVAQCAGLLGRYRISKQMFLTNDQDGSGSAGASEFGAGGKGVRNSGDFRRSSLSAASQSQTMPQTASMQCLEMQWFHYLNTCNIFLGLAGIGLLHLAIVAFITPFTDKSSFSLKVGVECVDGWEWFPLYSLLAVYAMFLILLAIFCLPQVDDVYNIRLELLVTIFLTLATFAVYIPFVYVHKKPLVDFDRRFNPAMWVCLSTAVRQVISMVPPIIAVYRTRPCIRKASLERSPTGGEDMRGSSRFKRFPLLTRMLRAFSSRKADATGGGDRIARALAQAHLQYKLFEEMLEDPVLFRDFKAFSVRDFSIENPLFHQHYQHLWSIYRRYHVGSSPAIQGENPLGGGSHRLSDGDGSHTDYPSNTLSISILGGQESSDSIKSKYSTAGLLESKVIQSETALVNGVISCLDTSDNIVFNLTVQLYNWFIKPGAEYELNIKATTVADIRSTLIHSCISANQPSPDIFKEAHKEVLNLMYLHTFPRFLESRRFVCLGGASVANTDAGIAPV